MSHKSHCTPSVSYRFTFDVQGIHLCYDYSRVCAKLIDYINVLYNVVFTCTCTFMTV